MSGGLERGGRAVRIATVVPVALKLALLFIFAWHSRLVMDEFLQLGYAKYLGNGMFDTLWPPKAVGFAVFYKLAHIIGWDATSILLAGRVQTALLACVTLALIYGCAQALGNDRFRSLAIILVLLSFSNFMERIFRTIAEPLAVFFAAAALLVVLRGRADQARTIVVAGILSGLSFLATQKALYFDIALGLALVVDAALAQRFRDGIVRGLWLVLGWSIPIMAYCFVFGGTDPISIAKNLVFGPVAVATTGADAYSNLRSYVSQTLIRNGLLYAFCLSGMVLHLLQIMKLDERTRIALIFTIIVTALVFAHNQPWPYVFIMALPFMSFWSLALFDREVGSRPYQIIVSSLLGIAVIASFVRNIEYLRIDNSDQMALVARAEALVGPNDVYFDGIAMLPNRAEPSTLWLDRASVLKTLQEKEDSEAFRVLSQSPPKVIIWSYRMDAVEPVVAPVIRHSYVQVAPNIRMPGQVLRIGVLGAFNVPIAGIYRLYDRNGAPVAGKLAANGALMEQPFRLSTGNLKVALKVGPPEALLLPEGNYSGLIEPGPDNKLLFAKVYD